MVGEWRTSGAHPLLPGVTLRHGRTSVSWHDGGAFLVMRSEVDRPDIPSGVARTVRTTSDTLGYQTGYQPPW